MSEIYDTETHRWIPYAPSAADVAAQAAAEEAAEQKHGSKERLEWVRRAAENRRLIVESMDPEVQALRKLLLDAGVLEGQRKTLRAEAEAKGKKVPDWQPVDELLERYERALLAQFERELIHPLARHAMEQGATLIGVIPAGVKVEGDEP